MLTDKTIKAAISTVTSELTLNDGATNGRGSGSLMLVVRRLSSGTVSATWYATWKRDGKRQKTVIGRYPETTLAMARQQMAADLAPKIRSGKAVKQVTECTVEGMFKAYVEALRAKGAASADETERVLLLAKHNAADALGRHRPPADVETDDVTDFVGGYFRRGHRGAADKARAYVSAAFGWALKAANDYTNPNRQDWGVRRNPVEYVKKDSEATTPRERALTAPEVAILWNAAGGKGFTLETGACVRLLICTGQRVQELLRMEAEEIDLAEKLWTIPAHKTKGRQRPHVVPLTSQAVGILVDLLAAHKTGPLFPARTGSKSALIHHQSIMQAIDRWLAGCKSMPRFQTRDLRRTWKTRGGQAGISKELRDLIQQHAKHDTGSKHYDRYEYLDEKRAAMTRWESWLGTVLAGAHPLPARVAA